MTARQVSEADRAVLEECARRGVTDVTARKLERWRRYLPDRVVEHRRGLRGSHTSNPPHYVDHVLALDALLKVGMPLRQAPIHLFAQGFSVRINDLRDAYADLYAYVRHGLTKNLTHIDEEPADHADRLATLHEAGIRKTTTGRRWAKRARQLATRRGARQGDDPDALFTAALSAMFTWLIAGEQPSSEGITDALSIAGLNDGQDPDAAGTTLAAMHLDAISTAIDRATQADWLTARQNLELLAHYTELRPSVEKLGLPDKSRQKGLTDVELGNPDVRAVLIPVALVFDETWLQRLLDQLEQFAVIARPWPACRTTSVFCSRTTEVALRRKAPQRSQSSCRPSSSPGRRLTPTMRPCSASNFQPPPPGDLNVDVDQSGYLASRTS